MENEKKGIFFAIVAALTYATYSVFVKLAVEVPPISMIFFRNITCLALLSPLFLKSKVSYKPNKLSLLSLRAVMGFVGLGCFYFAAKRLLLVDVVTLINTTPLFVPLVILIWDRVGISKSHILALIVGFLGILFILNK